MPIVVDSDPGEPGIVGAINAPGPGHLGTAVEGRVFMRGGRLAKADGAGGLDARDLGEGIPAVERMPDAVDGGCASPRQPDVSLASRSGLELRGRTGRR